jgi:hypothetical protein
MFWLVAVAIVAVVGLVLSMVLGAKKTGEKPKAFEDFDFPRSKEGDPVPRVYGTVLIKSPNTIHALNFSTSHFTQKGARGYKYYLTVALCWCLGPDVRFRKLWLGKDLIWTGCIAAGEKMHHDFIELDKLYGGEEEQGGIQGDVYFFNGDFDQPQSAVLTSLVDPNVSAYRGYAITVFHNGHEKKSGSGFKWGQSPQIQPPSAEVAVHTNTLEIGECKHIMPNGLDANPLEVLYDLIVNKWANLGIDPDYIDANNWRDGARVLWAEANGCSVIISNPAQGSTIAKEVMAQINASMYQDPSTGLIKVKLIRDDYVIADLPVLTPSEVSDIGNWTSILWSQTLNKVIISYKNRANNYEDGLAPQQDFANIRYQGKIRSGKVDMPLCYDSTLAAVLAARELTNVAVPLKKGTLTVNREAADLIPGDPFVLHWPEYGVEQMVLRVRKIGLGKREDGRVQMDVVQDIFATPVLSTTVPPPSEHEVEDFPAADVSTYLLWELPYWLSASVGTERVGYYRMGAFAKEPTTASVSYTAWIDTGGDPADDTEVVLPSDYTPTAKLNADLAQYTGWSNGTITSLVIKEVSDTSILVNGSLTAVRAGQGMFYLNDELLGFETFTDNGDGTYTLHNVHRSLLDTGYKAGLANDLLWFIKDTNGLFEDGVLPAPQSVYYIDRTYTDELEEPSATRHAVTPAGRKDLPIPPDDITIDAVRVKDLEVDVGATVSVNWHEREPAPVSIPVELDATQTPAAGTLYKLEVWSPDGLVRTEDDLTRPFSWTPGLAEQGTPSELRVYSKLDGAYSYSYASYPVSIIGDSLVVDGRLVTFPETVEFN